MDRLEYPNPQFVREKWTDLNGTWECALPTDPAALESVAFPAFDRTITVPYSYTFPAAGLEEAEYHPVIWYRRRFAADVGADKRFLLHFEAVDYRCDVWVNGQHVGSHQGGHTPFSFDVTPHLVETPDSENELVVKVVDDTDTAQPLGKQSWKGYNFGCWYTRTIGIWQNVWLEETGPVFLTDVRMIPSAHDAHVAVEAVLNRSVTADLDYAVTFRGEPVTRGSAQFTAGRARLIVPLKNFDPVPEIHVWSPATPDLYDIEFTVREDDTVTDTVSSYFGLRDVSADRGLVFLNEQKCYMKLLLNQGYYPGGGLTGTVEQFRGDIEKMKAMGFNGHRIHQKIESHRLLYLCDALGFFVWAEFPSPYEFSAQLMDNVLAEVPGFVGKHINHPAVLVYVMMNESWGVFDVVNDRRQQHFINALYYQAKAYDDSRLVIGNDGYEQTLTDLVTIHDYNVDAADLRETYQGRKREVLHGAPSPMSARRIFCDGYAREDLPILMTEFGGIAYAADEAAQDAWGYGDRLTDQEQVVQRIVALTQAVHDIEYCVGFCYTQTSDVEQEINGLLDHNHEYKFDPEVIREVVQGSNSFGYVKF